MRKLIAPIVVGIALLFSSITMVRQEKLIYKVNQLQGQNTALEMSIAEQQLAIDTLQSKVDTLTKIHPWKSFKSRWREKGLCASGTFMGFLLYCPVDTAICSSFKQVLAEYPGPAARVNSLKRGYNSSSKHYTGKAIDLEFSHEVIEFLVSEAGQKWLVDNGLTFYIEGKPGSKRVSKYLRAPYSRFVFFNPSATGDHIHINA